MKLFIRSICDIISPVSEKIALKLLLTCSLLTIACVQVANANETTLHLNPPQCVAIHQGQTCYVDIELQWRAPSIGKYCLFSSQQSEPLRCWMQSDQGQFEREIVAQRNVVFFLRKEKNNDVLATRELEMAWVYKKSAKARSSWRMF
jgi:hypothetical protein